MSHLNAKPEKAEPEEEVVPALRSPGRAGMQHRF